MRDLFFYFTFAVGLPFDTSENFYNYILSISLYHHLVKRERFLQDNYIIPVTHPLWSTTKLFYFSCFYFKYITPECSPFEHSGIFLCKNFINSKSSAFELFKKIHNKKTTQQKLSYFLYKLLNFIYLSHI